MRPFRIIALAEASSFLALLVATYVKHTDGGATGVSILGPIHGALFVAYILVAWSLHDKAGWSPRTTALVMLGAVIPFGGYAVDAWLSRQPPLPA